MIRFIIARNPGNDKFETYLKPSLDGLPQDKISVVEIFNDQADSIHKKYNIGLDKHKELGSKDDDIICFVHADVKIHDENFIQKVELVFNKRKDVGCLGLIGTKFFAETGGWWLCDHLHHFGRLIQGKPGTNGTEKYEMNRGVGFSDKMVVVDGFCFFSTFKIADEIRFDESLGGYHFYEYNFCFSCLEKGYKVVVADIIMEHASPGPLSPLWYLGREKFLNKWKNEGVVFPVMVENFNK